MSESIEKKVDRILFYLENDPATGKEGFVSKVNRLDKDFSNAKAKVSGIVIVLTIVFNTAFWLFNKFVK